MASKYDVVDGRVVRLVAENVEDQDAHAAALQADLDDKQNVVNNFAQAKAQTENELAELEMQAEAKANQLEESKTALESAESELAKSLDSRNSFLAAIELANSQPVTSEDDGTGDGVEGVAEDPTDVTDRISVVSAEG